MNATNVSLVPLQHASLCLDCETITASQSRCHACGSSALMNVARALSQPGYKKLSYNSHSAIAGMASLHKPFRGDFLHST